MKLYMIRHGESTANAEHRHAGWGQVPLTEKGRADARYAKEILQSIRFDRIYVSDLIRAKETLALALPGAEGIETALLREIGVGELSGHTIADCEVRYGASYLANKAASNYVPYGGENHEMHLERLRSFADRLTKEPCSSVAAFCHEGSIRCMLEISLGHRCSAQDYALLHNGSVSVFEYENGKWSCLFWDKRDLF